MRRAATLFMLLAIFTSSSAWAVPGSAHVSGRVTNSLGEGLNKICVVAIQLLPDLGGGNGSISRSTETDVSGAYSFELVVPGEYRFRFYDCNYPQRYLPRWYKDGREVSSADTVLVTPGAEISGVDIQLVLGGSIAGRVTAEAGGPISNALVEAYSESGATATYGWTNASGEYLLGAIDTGSYAIRFATIFGSPLYATEWFDNQPARTSANLIDIAPGEEVTGIDAELVELPPPPKPLPDADWVLVKIKAGPEGATNVGAYGSSRAVTVGEGPRLLGSGWGGSSTPGGIRVRSAGGGDIGITATNGRADVSLVPDPAGGYWAGLAFSMWSPSLEPGETDAFLVFMTSQVMTGMVVSFRNPTAGSATMEITYGAGSTPLLAVDPGDEGTAVRAGPLAVGSSVHRINSSAGLAGGFLDDIGFCNICHGSWTGPDNKTHRWNYVSVTTVVVGAGLIDGSLTFSGNAGSWLWEWCCLSGVQAKSLGLSFDSVPAYGAYAPIGSDFGLFGPEKETFLP